LCRYENLLKLHFLNLDVLLGVKRERECFAKQLGNKAQNNTGNNGIQYWTLVSKGIWRYLCGKQEDKENVSKGTQDPE
jgi:hypothetical protein